MTEEQRETNEDRDDENTEGHGVKFGQARHEPRNRGGRKGHRGPRCQIRQSWASNRETEEAEEDTEGHGSRFPKRGLDD